MIDENVGVRVSMGPLAERPDPTGEGVGVGDFYTDIDTGCMYQLKRNQTTGVLSWIEAECPDSLPPAAVLPDPNATPGATIVVLGITYISVQTAPGVYNWVAINGAPPPPAPALAFADFFALMPGDNAATIAQGAPVLFPQDGPTSASGITRTAPGVFQLADVGTYRVDFQASVDEPGQLQLSLNGTPLADTVAGRATGTSQISGTQLVTTSAPNSLLSVINPAGNAAALTITPTAGGTHAVSAHIVIQRLS